MNDPNISTNAHYSHLFLAHQKTALALRNGAIKDRKKKLVAIRSWIMANQMALQEGEYLDLKKPQDEVNVTELYPLLAEIKHAVGSLSVWTAPSRVGSSLTFLGTRAAIHYEPKGTALIISPWNYPLLLAIGPLISAVAAGNTAVLKPSEFTPATNRVIAQMIQELFDEEEVVMLEGEADVSSRLLELPFDHIFFTGSPAIGKVVMTAAAKNLSSLTLELGGKSPTIIDETADLQDAAAKLSWAKWTNAGQTCVAPDYLFIHERKKEEFLKEFEARTRQMYGDKQCYASIINSRHYQRLENTLKDAIDKGAVVIFTGQDVAGPLDFQPVVIEKVSDEMAVMNEEIFGPIFPIMTYKHLSEVIDYINSKPKPLALYHYSRSRANKQRILKETSSGTLVYNDSVIHFGHPHLPAGGVNNSGLGKAHGHAGFLAFSHDKSVMSQRIGLTVAKMVRPPYSKFKKEVIKFMLKYL